MLSDKKPGLSSRRETGDALRMSRWKNNRNWTLPEGKKIAVWIVVNIEDFDLRYPIDGGESVPDFRAYALREYGNRAGMARILAELDRFRIKGTGAVNGAFARNFPEWIKECSDRDWDLMGHGDYNNRKMHTYSPDEEKELIHKVLDDIEIGSGTRPVGWLSPGLQQSEHTLNELSAAGIQYVADFVCDDRPFEIPIDKRTMISVPYSMDINDKGAYGKSALTPDGFRDLIISQFDELSRDAKDGPVAMVIAVHPYLTGLPYRISALRGALENLVERDGIWWATGAEIAQRFQSSR